MYMYRYGKTLWTEEEINAEIHKMKIEARSHFISDVVEINGELFDQASETKVENLNAKYKDCSGGWGFLGEFETEEEITKRLSDWKERLKEDWSPEARAGRYMKKKFYEYNQQFRQPAIISDFHLIDLGYWYLPHEVTKDGIHIKQIDEYIGGTVRKADTEIC